MARRYRVPQLVFIRDREIVHRQSYPYQSEDVPRRGDSVRLPGNRTKRHVREVVYVYGKYGLLRIEIMLIGRRKR